MSNPRFVEMKRAYDGARIFVNIENVTMIAEVDPQSPELPAGERFSNFACVMFCGNSFAEVRGSVDEVARALGTVVSR